MGVFIQESGACVSDTPVKYWEFPPVVFATDTCTHKIGFSNIETIVTACKAHVGRTDCEADSNCEFKPRCSHNIVTLVDSGTEFITGQPSTDTPTVINDASLWFQSSDASC